MDMGNDGEERQRRLTRQAMDQAGLTSGQVWVRYFGLAGEAGEYEVDAYLNGLLGLPAVQRDLISHAVNELADGIPGRQRAPYSRGLDGDGPAEPHSAP